MLWTYICPVRVWVGVLVILTEAFRGFYQSFQANTGIVLRLGYDRFLENLSQFEIHSLLFFLQILCFWTLSIVVSLSKIAVMFISGDKD
jgi:hypothetical protein